MQVELVTFNIVGVRPLMQNTVDVDSLEKEVGVGKRAAKATGKTSLEEARDKLHVTEDGRLFHPGQAFWKAMVLACPNITIGGKAASGIVPRAVEPAEEEVILYDPETLKSKSPRPLGDKDWMVDRRAIQTSKGLIIARRPIFKSWGARLVLEVDRGFIPERADNALLEILNIAGKMGVGSGRLRKEGSEWYGIRMGKFTADFWKL